MIEFKDKSKATKDFLRKKSVEELNSMYSVLSRGNGGGSADEQLSNIEEIFNKKITDYNLKEKKDKK